MDEWQKWMREKGEQILKRTARKWGKNEADELFQQLQIATWQAFALYGAEDTLRKLPAIVNRKIIDHLRRKSVRLRRFERLEDYQDEESNFFDLSALVGYCRKTGNHTAEKIIAEVASTGTCHWQKLYAKLGITKYIRDNAFAPLRELDPDDFKKATSCV